MAFARVWPPRAVAGCWPHAVRRAASAYLLDPDWLLDPDRFPDPIRRAAWRGCATKPRGWPAGKRSIAGERACKAQDARRFSSCRRRTPPGGAPGVGAAGGALSTGKKQCRDCAGRLHRQPKGRERGGPQSGEAAVARGSCRGAGPRRPTGDRLRADRPCRYRRTALCGTRRRSRGGAAPDRPAGGSPGAHRTAVAARSGDLR